MNPLADLMRSTADRLGISPLDLATAISYETGGTFDPWQKGPTTKWGQHRGLIQMGEPQRAQYGYTQDEPLPAQFDAIGRYLTDAGVQPGMGLMDVESAINAGRVGRYGASDAAAGGAPGTVRDKVEHQMAGHVAKAQALLGGGATQPPSATPPDTRQNASRYPADTTIRVPPSPALLAQAGSPTPQSADPGTSQAPVESSVPPAVDPAATALSPFARLFAKLRPFEQVQTSVKPLSLRASS